MSLIGFFLFIFIGSFFIIGFLMLRQNKSVEHQEYDSSYTRQRYQISASVPSSFYDDVQDYCRHHGITTSDLIRNAVREYMKSQSTSQNSISQEKYVPQTTNTIPPVEQKQIKNIELRQTPYRRYKVKGKNPATNRLKTCIVVAKDSLSEEEIGLKSGFLEPYTVTVDSESYEECLPSEYQLEYVNDLGISIPPGCTYADVSCIISKELETDSSDFISNGLICFAGDNNIRLSPYAGIQSSVCRLFNALEDRERFAFFAYLIYCLKNSLTVEDLRSSCYKNVFYDFSDLYINNSEFRECFFFDETHIAYLISKKTFDKRSKKKTWLYETTCNFLSEHSLL